MSRSAIIIGAGIGGLSSAITLSRIGFDVRIYEKSDALRTGGAGITLWPNATNALRKMGLLDEVYARSRTVNDSAIITDQGKVLSVIPFTRFAEKYGAFSVGILRKELFEALAGKLQGNRIYNGYRCVSVGHDGHQATAYFANGHKDTADLLIGADGIHSAVRDHLFQGSKLRPSGVTAWRGIAYMDHEYCKTGYAFECWGRGLRFGFLPVSRSAAYWFVTKKQSASEPLEHCGKEELLNWFANFPEPILKVIQTTNEDDILRSELADLLPLKKWVTEMAALLGDAAHATTPNLGQGACLALEDAVVLAQCLERKRDIKKALLAYEKLRRRRAKRVVQRSRWFGILSQWENPLLAQSRNLLLIMMPPTLQQAYYREIIGYRV